MLSLPAVAGEADGRGGGVGGRLCSDSLPFPPSLPQEASVLFIKQNQQWICLETFLPDTRYELQVRVKPQLDSHEVWSPWSQPLAFRTRPAGTRGQRG